MKKVIGIFFSLVFTLLLGACSPETTPESPTKSPTFTRLLASSTPTITDTPTPSPSPTVTITSTPVTLDLTLVDWMYGDWFGPSYFSGIVRNNTDYGIVAPAGGSLTVYCVDGTSQIIPLSNVPPLPPHAEAAFYQDYFYAESKCRNYNFKRATIEYNSKGLLLEDADHEISRWNVEMAGLDYSGPHMQTMLLTAENTTHFPCMIDTFVTFAFDKNGIIMAHGFTFLSTGDEINLPVPPMQKMGFRVKLDKWVYNHAAKVKSFPISRNFDFCENPALLDSKSKANTRHILPMMEHQLETVQSGLWAEPDDPYRLHYAFTVKNTDSDFWADFMYYHADLYDSKGKLAGIYNGSDSMSIPPLGRGAGLGWISVDYPGTYSMVVFAYGPKPTSKRDITNPIIKDITWDTVDGQVVVSCLIYNPGPQTYQDIRIVGILFDQNQHIIGGGTPERKSGLGVLNPDEEIQVTMQTQTNNKPTTIEIFTDVR
jgi:hypothetical protein